MVDSGATDRPGAVMRVAVVAEFYPSERDPVLGIWSHRQALAARDAGAEVEVLALHRLVPPASALRGGPREATGAVRALLAQPRRTTLDGLSITYVPWLSPGRGRSYGAWGRWAAPPLGAALRSLRSRFAFELVHAHNAVPAGDAVRRAELGVPTITSVHGGDVFYTARQRAEWAQTVRASLDASALVLANSTGIADACRELTDAPVEVLLLGADVPEREARPPQEPTLITVAHLVARKRHADVIRAMWVLRSDWPTLRYVIVGDGPERAALERLARELGVIDRITFTGQLPHPEATSRLAHATLFVMPSVDEAYGVAYVEAMAHGLPTIAALGEPGPLDLADLGTGIQLAAPGDVEHLARVIDRLLSSRDDRRALGQRGRRVVQERCSWEQCGANTVEHYRQVLAGASREGAAT